MTYKIAALAVQPVLVTMDDDGNLGPLPEGMQVPSFSVGIADLKGAPLYDRLSASLEALNAQVDVAANGHVPAEVPAR
jgi:hypothetical protein